MTKKPHPKATKRPYGLEDTADFSKTYISMQSLKQFAQEKLPDSALKDILLSEGDEVSVQEFVVKLPLYLRLLKRAESYE